MPTNGLETGDDGLARPAWAAHDPLLRHYYDTEWGMRVRDGRGLFGRLSLEPFQSGLSWASILRKRPAFREAFDSFDPDAVAAYGEATSSGGAATPASCATGARSRPRSPTRRRPSSCVRTWGWSR